MAKDPMVSAQKWANNLGSSTQAITDGVNGVTVAPGTLAAKQADVWAQNTAAAKSKFARNSQAVTLGEWQQAMKDKGIARIAAGATAAIPKMQAFLTAFIPHVEAGVRALPPRGNLQQNINRMVQMVNHNASFAKRAGM